MNATTHCRSARCGGLLVLIGAMACGCASLKLPPQIPEDVSEPRKMRREAVVEEFEASRDRAQFEAAAARWEQDDVAACREELERILTRSPDHRDSRLLMAEVLLADGKAAESLGHVQRVLNANPEDAHAHYMMGVVLDATGQSTGASAHYQKAYELEPSRRLYRLACSPPGVPPTHAPLPPGRSPAEAGAASHAEVSAAIGGAAEPPLPPVREPRVSTAGFSLPGGSDSTKYVDQTDRSGSNANRSAMDLINDGRAVLREGSPAVALEYFRRARQLQPDNPQIAITSAVCALESNQPEMAVALLEEASVAYPRSAALCRTLGLAHYRCGDYRASQLVLQQSLSLDNSSALAYFLMGCVLNKLGQHQPAEAHLRQARLLDPRYNAAR